MHIESIRRITPEAEAEFQAKLQRHADAVRRRRRANPVREARRQAELTRMRASVERTTCHTFSKPK